MQSNKTRIQKIYSYIKNNKEQMLNVYYVSGLVRYFYPLQKQLPKTICEFICNSNECFLTNEIKLYYMKGSEKNVSYCLY